MENNERNWAQLLKVIYHESKTTTKAFYLDAVLVTYDDFVNRLHSELTQRKLTGASFEHLELFWKDEDDDHVLIANASDYHIFLRLNSGENFVKVNVCLREPTIERSQLALTNDENTSNLDSTETVVINKEAIEEEQIRSTATSTEVADPCESFEKEQHTDAEISEPEKTLDGLMKLLISHKLVASPPKFDTANICNYFGNGLHSPNCRAGLKVIKYEQDSSADEDEDEEEDEDEGEDKDVDEGEDEDEDAALEHNSEDRIMKNQSNAQLPVLEIPKVNASVREKMEESCMSTENLFLAPDTEAFNEHSEEEHTGFVEQASPLSPAPNCGQLIYHPNAHVNESVYQMLEMGFTNDNNQLVRLCERYNGNIVHIMENMNVFIESD